MLIVAVLLSALASTQTDARLPVGNAPAPLAFPHFPTRFHAYVWRNWTLVPIDRIASAVGAGRSEVLRAGKALGLPDPPRITPDQQRRSYLTVIRRNWHLLPYDQLLKLLNWTAEEMAFTLREDDFLYIKLGSHKPKCDPIRPLVSNETILARERRIAAAVREQFPGGLNPPREAPFAFVKSLSRDPGRGNAARSGEPSDSLRFCYSYFALYGDPLLDGAPDPYPEGLLARLKAVGVNGVWLQAVLYKLAPFPWDPGLSDRYQERLRNLNRLVARAKRHGIRVLLYLNEPRAMPLPFFESRPGLKGVSESDYATLCTSTPEVRRYLTDSVASLCAAVPDLGGLFTITASENLTNCWSHGNGAACSRCSKRPAFEVIAEVNRHIAEGIARARSTARLIAWDWGWSDSWAPDAIRSLPKSVGLMSVSEWNLPIERGGVKSAVGEYSISSVGPGPRALSHWKIAREHGLRVYAKIQAGNTWELSAIPYIPAVQLVAQHAENLHKQRVDGIMLGWTLGGYPSPNLEAASRALAGADADAALESVAAARYGPAAPAVNRAWKAYSAAFKQFPYSGSTVYTAPLQFGPSNLLWATKTGYSATMIGFPYDDLDAWRSIYPPQVFISQLEKVASGFAEALPALRSPVHASPRLMEEANLAEAAALHFQSAANQSRFIVARDRLAAADAQASTARLTEIELLLRAEIQAARRLYDLQSSDSRIGFEASNHYYYMLLDLVEKILNCQDLLERWLPEERKRLGMAK